MNFRSSSPGRRLTTAHRAEYVDGRHKWTYLGPVDKLDLDDLDTGDRVLNGALSDPDFPHVHCLVHQPRLQR